MEGLWQVMAATLAFVGGHFLLSHPLRRPIVGQIGEKAFLGTYSIIMLAAFGWLIWAAWTAPATPLWWVAPGWVWDVSTLVTLIAAVLLAGSLSGNPALPDPDRQRSAPADPKGVLAITRHPMMWGFGLWAITHVALWGNPAHLIVTAGIGILALAGAAAQDAKKEKLIGAAWREWERRTAFLPFAAQVSGRLPWATAWPGARKLGEGAVLWLVATWAHTLVGGPPAGVWRWF